jgi:hypothetical protein
MKAEIQAISQPISLVQCWCTEAVSKFGDDWPLIYQHVRQKLSALAEDDRVRILQAISLVLGQDSEDQIHYQ